MCLIVVKPIGKTFPHKKQMKQWFNWFPDGVGISFQDKGRVRTVKGAMTIPAMHKLESSVEKYLHRDGKRIEDTIAIIQFRAAITGSVCQKYCHPFPITKNQEALNGLNVVSDKALAHNGIIWEYNGYYSVREDVYAQNYYAPGSHQRQKGFDINDAQEFIVDYLVDMGESIWNKGVQNIIEAHTESKFAVLSGNQLALIGSFIEDGGYLYSNAGYKPAPPIKSITCYRKLPLPITELGGKPISQDSKVVTNLNRSLVQCEPCGEWVYSYELKEHEGNRLCPSCYALIGLAGA